MANIRKSYSQNKSQYTLSYSDMHGVDFGSGGHINQKRYAYLENMYKDYSGVGGALIESIPGFRRIKVAGKKINRLFCQKTDDAEYIIVHSENALYRFNLAEKDEKATSLSPIATVKDTKSCAFNAGGDIYILDGETITKISKDGTVSKVGEEGALPYIPITFFNGSEYQQRNLLTNNFKERFTVSTSDTVTYGCTDLQYRITDSEKKFCAVSGMDSDFAGGSVYIPSYTDIGGVKYLVTEILDGAFINNIRMINVIINEGLIKIGRSAFKGCKNIKKVITPTSLVEIGESAFSGNNLLSDFYLGVGVRFIGGGAFADCANLKTIKFGGSASDITSIEDNGALTGIEITDGERDKSIKVNIPVYTPASSITRVTINGEDCEFLGLWNGEIFTGVLFDIEEKYRLDGKLVEIHGTYNEEYIRKRSGEQGLLAGSDFVGTGSDAIFGCTVCESFDGRIFLAGNQKLPNTVIYSERDESGNNNPLYFGVYNYFSDGIGSFPVISMLATGDSLAVFKAEDDGGGSIFYHIPTLTSSDVLPKIYPVSYIHSGICAVGDCISFYDDPVFVSRNGISALAKRQINLERSIACRSHNVNPRLLTENLSEISLAKWCGYLVVCTGEHIYLADSRAVFVHESGNTEYEWYYLSGIGTYKSSKKVFKYASESKNGYIVHPTPDIKIDPSITVWLDNSTGEMLYFTNENEVKYQAVKTDEYVGGTFYPATAILSVRDELLLFGTSNGDVCIFNNDKRGIPPDRIKNAVDFDAEEYSAIYGRRIHPDFYDFATHAPTYALKTPIDNCGIPHLTKDTVKNSLTLKCRLDGLSGSLICEAGTDKSGYEERISLPFGVVDFSDIDFSSITLSGKGDVTVPISEKEKNWIEKQISINTNDFRAPIGIHSITYRFKVKGRIKNNR